MMETSTKKESLIPQFTFKQIEFNLRKACLANLTTLSCILTPFSPLNFLLLQFKRYNQKLSEQNHRQEGKGLSKPVSIHTMQQRIPQNIQIIQDDDQYSMQIISFNQPVLHDYNVQIQETTINKVQKHLFIIRRQIGEKRQSIKKINQKISISNLTSQERRYNSLHLQDIIFLIGSIFNSSEEFQKRQQKIPSLVQPLIRKNSNKEAGEFFLSTNDQRRSRISLICMIKIEYQLVVRYNCYQQSGVVYQKIQMASKSSKVLLLALILILAFDLTGVQASTLPSYVPNPNCQTTNSTGDCTACSNGFYLSFGYCYTGNPFCATYNPNTGACLTCNGTEQFSNGFCIRVSTTCAGGSSPPCNTCDQGYTVLSIYCVLAASLSPFCDTFSGSACSNCVAGYFLFSGGCAQANPICQTYNMTNGQCLSCYAGLIVLNGNCVSAQTTNPLCSTFSGIICTACQSGYFIFNGLCTLGNPFCATYSANGGCLTCSTGTLVGNLCLVFTTCTDLDGNGNCNSCSTGNTPWGTQCVSQSSLYPFCQTFGANNACTACISGAFLSNGVCLPGNPFCKTSDASGRCLSCYPGDILQSSICLVLAPSCATQTAGGQCSSCNSGYSLLGQASGACVLLASVVPVCSSFSGNNCLGCLNGYYINSGICIQANPACLTYNPTTGACDSCYNGLSVLGNTCGSTAGLNPFCSSFNGAVCSLCSTGYTLYNGICYLANPNCATYGPGGICLSCAQGNLEGYLCLVSTSCDTYDDTFTYCLTCPTGYTLWNSQCISYSSLYPFCQTFDGNNLCTSCSPGSYFSNGVCVTGNPFCATYNSDGSCNTCTAGNQKVGPLCLVISPGCTTGSNGLCSACPAGYTLLNGVCVNIISLNPYCSALSGSFCTSCIVGYYVYNGQCYLASSLCYSYNMNTGACTACYNGYIVYNGACVVINLALVNPNCQTFNGLVCTVCNSGFYFYQGICIAVNQYCGTFDPNTGYCTSCVQGTLYGNYCYITIACATVDGSNNCVTCPTGYVVWSTICVSFASLYPYCSAYSGLTCSACYNGYYISNGICVLGNPFCATTNINTGDCLSCLFGYTLYSGSCLQNSLCSSIDSYGNCLACPAGYTLWTFNLCISIQSLNPYCSTFDNSGICTACSLGYYFSQGFCVALNSICADYDQNTGACLNCPYGYTLYGYFCFNVLSTNQYCSAYTGVTCSACQNGYYLNNGICILANAFCATFDLSGNCLSCISGFTLNGVLCTANVACTTTGANGFCLSCPSGYLVFSGLCVSIQSSNPFCITFTGATCTVCQNGYYIASSGFCSIINSNCLTYSMNTGACLTCGSGYVLFGSICWSYILQNPYCSTFSGIVCTNCFAGYYFNSGICVKGSSLCATVDVNNGNCLTCIPGYALQGTSCIVSTACATVSATGQCESCPPGYTIWFGLCISQQSANPYCLTFTGPQCLVCQNRYFLNNVGICVGLISDCLTYDMTSGSCLTCPSSYSLIGSICWSVITVNPYCSTFNGLICTACNQGYYFQNGICVIANPFCLTFDVNTGFCLTCISGYFKSGNLCYIEGVCLTSAANGNCLTCSVGFTLFSNKCVAIQNVNPYCKTFASGTNTCTACFDGYYIGSNGICRGLNSVCYRYDMNTGACISCPSGFILYGKICWSVVILNPYCATFTGITCNYCKAGYYLNNGICVLANALCATYQMNTGNCLSCYSGYTINGIYCIQTVACLSADASGKCLTCPTGYIVWNGLCILIGNNNPYCKTFSGATCTVCFNGYYFGPGNICIGLTSLCNTYDQQTGACLTCPQGYTLQGATCWSFIINNPYCQVFNNGICTACYDRYFFTPTKICTAVNPLCLTYDMGNGACLSCNPGDILGGSKCLRNTNCTTAGSNGNCQSCPTGYSIFNGLCVTLIGLNPYCITFDKAFCTDCQPGYFINQGNVCVALNTPCATYVVTTGACLTCPTGYILYGSICWSITLHNPFCSSFTGITCNACNPGFYLSNGICVLGNALCATYNLNTGSCLTCIANYTFQNGLCLANIPCTTSDSTGCLTCPSGYTVYNFLCISLISLNPYCLTFSGATCTVCRNGYFLGPLAVCTVLNSLCATYNMQTGACNTCPQGYTKVGFACYSLLVQNPYCASFSTSTCRFCFNGYYLNNGICIAVSAYCATYTMATGLCLTCKSGYTLFSGLCLAQIACLTQDSNGFCTSCPSGYQIWQNVCIRIITLNPYCLTFNGLICSVCLPNYYIGSNGICTALSSACNTYNMQTGFCLSCPVGYIFYNNQCTNLVYTNPFCQLFTAITCTLCYDRFWLNNGLCVPVNNLCNTYDHATGNCLSCKSGYILNNGLCIKNSPCLTTNPATGACITCSPGFIVFLNLCIDITTLNPYCQTWSGNVCTVCQTNYFIGTNGICVAVSKFCDTYDQLGNCVTCPAGYALFGGNCWNLALPIPPNPYCSIFAGTACTTCYYGWYLAAGVCVPSNQYCLTYNMIGGACYTCVVGYYLSGTICLVSDPTCATLASNGNCATCNLGFTLWGNKCVGIPSTNPYCQTFNVATCTWCYPGYYLSNGYCVVANPYCNGYNMNTGVCLACYPGYYLSGALCFNADPNCLTINPANGWCLTCPTGYAHWGNTCVSQPSLNPYCAVFLASGACSVCSQGYYISVGICVAANPYCQTYSQTSGACFTCYAGYYLSGALCLVSNPQCATIDANNLCLTCFAGYTVVSGNCVSLVSINPWCLTFSGSACTQCSAGYYLGGGICIVANPYCLTYHPTTGVCLSCSAGYYLSGTNCLVASPICQTVNSLGACTSCYLGYIIWGNTCIAQNSLNPYCSSFSGTTCVNCYYGYYLGAGTCIVVNPYCATYNMQTGACLSCNAGYYLSGTQCWVQNPQCATVDINNNCLTCFAGFAILGNTCVSQQTINPYCQTFVGSTCNLCYTGYYLSLGICVAANPYCLTYNQNGGACLTCSSGYYLSNSGLCLVLSPYCSSADGNGYCTSCVSGYIVSGQICVSQTTNNPYCSQWNGPTCTWCYQGYYLGSGTCIAANPHCASYSMSTGACLSCYSGFYLNGALCLQMNPYCLTVDSAGLCLTCFAGYAPSAGFCLPYATVNPYCTSWAGSTCSVCAIGYFLGINGLCVVGNSNCETWNINTGICLTCYQGYYLNGGYCLAANPTCATSDSNGLCLTCASGYTVVSGTCVSLQYLNPYCAAFLASGTCSLCTTGYYIAVGICVAVNPWCLTYNQNTGACLSCSSGYYLSGAYCIASSPTCATTGAGGICLTCAQGYVVQSGVCVAYVTINPYCQAFLASGTCSLCYIGYYIFSGICVPSNPWCLTYQMSNGLCLSCNSGYYLNSGFCYLANPNCLTYNNGNCLTCSSGYVVIGGQCVYTPTSNPWCSTWSSLTCTWCYNGYYLSNGVCVVANPWCFAYTMTTGLCTSCNAGYYLNAVGNCVVANNNCATYASNGNCVTCATNWIISGNTCIYQPSNPYCINWTATTCTACQAGYYLGTGICSLADVNCGTYSQVTGYCLTCNSGWTLSGNQCVNLAPQNPHCTAWNGPLCTYCSNGYYVGVNGVCTAVSTYCQTYSMTTGYCLTCNSGYYLNSGSCLPNNPLCATSDSNGNCLTCYSGYTIAGNTCVSLTSIDSNCQTWFGLSCTLCGNGYYIGTNGVCTPANQYCATFDPQNGNCLTCPSGWVLSGTNCVAVIANCATYLNGLCTVCAPGWYVTASGSCGLTIANCATYLNGLCSVCAPGWYVTASGSCGLAIANCATYLNGLCTVCAPGWYVTASGSCGVAIANCATYLNGLCSVCAPGWYVTASGSCGLADPHCATYLNGLCTVCAPGWYVTASGSCGLAIANCATYLNGLCSVCAPGWYVTASGSCGLTIANCATYLNGLCSVCAPGWYVTASGSCGLAIANCATYHNGLCTVCAPGWYVTASGSCGVAIANCATYLNGLCTVCAPGWYVTASGSCGLADPHCATYLNGLCTVCAPGWYVTASGSCGLADPYCKTYLNGLCTACIAGYFVTASGSCAVANALCSTYNMNGGACTSCPSGYVLSGATCVVSTPVSIAWCNTYSGSTCTNCMTGYYVTSAGICAAKNPLCANYNMNGGACTSCNAGYAISGNTCVVSPTPVANPYCQTYSGTTCTNCYNPYYIGANGICTAASASCKTYNMQTGFCTSCYTGWNLNTANGVCG